MRCDQTLTMSMFEDERETIKWPTPSPLMFIQLVGIPVPQDGSGVVTTGDVPVPPCRPLSWKSHPSQIDDYSLFLYVDVTLPTWQRERCQVCLYLWITARWTLTNHLQIHGLNLHDSPTEQTTVTMFAHTQVNVLKGFPPEVQLTHHE